MVDIELTNNKTGYDVVGEYIRRYWTHNIYETVIVYLGVSCDGKNYELCKEVASPYNLDDVEFLYDWWEGEKFIRIIGIQSIENIDISGGIYMEENNHETR